MMECSCHEHGEISCIKIVPIFSNLTHEEMLEVASITTDKTFEKGEMVYSSGDNGRRLYVVHQGKVKVTRISSNGKEQIIRIVGPGEFLGELTIFSSAPLTDNGEAIEKTNVCIIDGKSIRQLMEHYPSIMFKIMEELSKRLEKAENLIENISLNSAEKRLAETLLSLSSGKTEVILDMSKRDFASQIGMSQETLSRKLSAFQDAGLIKLTGQRRIILIDMDGLREIE